MLKLDPYPYQDDAIDMCLDRKCGLVAYEMGLGKTVVGLAVAEELLGQVKADTILLVVPGGVKYQWARAIARFTDVATRKHVLRPRSKNPQEIEIPTEEHCILLNGTPEKRKAQYKQIEDISPDYVIVGYEQVINDWRQVKRIKAECIILDEATAIKTFRAKRTKRIKMLWAPYRIALTGTPVENRPDELYSIMEWVDPSILGGWMAFERAYIKRDKNGKIRKYKNLDILYEKLNRTVLARKTRLDPDVAPYMPEVQTDEVYVGMAAKSRRLYNLIAEELLEDLHNMTMTVGFDPESYYRGDDVGGDMTAAGKVAAKMMALQMLCDHPELLVDSARHFQESREAPLGAPIKGSKYAYELWVDGELDDLGKSEKFAVIVEDVHKIMQSNPNNKIILFSFFKGMLTRLQDALADYGSVIYNGELNADQKAAALAEFQNDPECRIFLSTDAGGMGVDLPQANHLLNYDQTYSSGKMDQRNARHVRADSSHEKVLVANYLVEGSTEERIYSSLTHKRSVASAILDGQGLDRHETYGDLVYDVTSLTEYLEHTEVAALS